MERMVKGKGYEAEAAVVVVVVVGVLQCVGVAIVTSRANQWRRCS